jgi:hypothetical protein
MKPCHRRRGRWAQQAIPAVGSLEFGAPETRAYLVAGFRKGLGELGHIEGRNVTIEYRLGGDEP